MKIAILTHTFPPSKKPNAKRPHYMVQAFLAAGWEVDVYTSPIGCDGNVEKVISHPALRVFVLGDYKEKLSKLAAKIPIVSRFCLSLLSGLSWPDTNATWVKKVSKILQKKNDYDRVLAYVFPASMFLTGRYQGLVDETWTFDLQESVTPQARIVKRRSPLMKVMLPKLEAVEKLALGKAGKVIFTANTNRQAYIDAGIVDESKTVHIPYFYEDHVFENKTYIHHAESFTISYYGTFDWRGSRSPKTFLHSFRAFLDATPEARKVAKFVFYGAWLSEHNQLIDELNLSENVQINASIGYVDYINSMISSSVLLLVVSSAHNLFMPSKIVDYFGASRPILAYVPEHSEMAQVLSDAGMQKYAVSEFDIEKGSQALEGLWESHQSNQLSVDAEKVSQWSSKCIIPQYISSVEGGVVNRLSKS